MARTASALIALLILAGCTSTTEKRLEAAAQAQGQALARLSLPENLPAECTDMVGKVKPGGEAWAVSFKRQEILIDNRDDKSVNCAKWWREYRTGVAKVAGSG